MTAISGRVAFVTGAGGGLGAGVARALADQGASLALVDMNATLLAERKAEFDQLGVTCEVCTLDVSDAEAVNTAASDFEERLGPISLCINNAGVGYVGAPLDEVPLRDFEWVIAVNVIGVFNCIRALVPAMRQALEGLRPVTTFCEVMCGLGLVGRGNGERIRGRAARGDRHRCEGHRGSHQGPPSKLDEVRAAIRESDHAASHEA